LIECLSLIYNFLSQSLINILNTTDAAVIPSHSKFREAFLSDYLTYHILTGFQAILVEESKVVPCCGSIKQWSFFLGGLKGTITLQVSFSFTSGDLRIKWVCTYKMYSLNINTVSCLKRTKCWLKINSVIKIQDF